MRSRYFRREFGEGKMCHSSRFFSTVLKCARSFFTQIIHKTSSHRLKLPVTHHASYHSRQGAALQSCKMSRYTLREAIRRSIIATAQRHTSVSLLCELECGVQTSTCELPIGHQMLNCHINLKSIGALSEMLVEVGMKVPLHSVRLKPSRRHSCRSSQSSSALWRCDRLIISRLL